MPIRVRPFDQITAADINALMERRIREDRTIDYKLELAFTDDGRFELLKDVTAMANSSGGTVVYGVREGEGDDSGILVATPGLAGSADDYHNRVGQLLQDCVDERIPGVLHRAVDRQDGGFYYLVRVPASHLAPHMIAARTTKPRFYARGTTTNQPMDARQIKEVALRAETAVDRAKSLIGGRLEAARLRGAIFQRAEPERRVDDQALLHLIPLFPPSPPVDLSDPEVLVRLAEVPRLGRTERAADEPRFSLEGVYFELPPREPLRYVLHLRQGGLEFQQYNILTETQDKPPKLELRAERLEIDVTNAIGNASKLFKAGLLPSPILVSLSLLRVQHSILGAPDWPGYAPPDEQHSAPYSDIDLVLDPWLLTGWDSSAERELRRMFDTVWQAYGHRCSPFYDESGKRKPPKRG
jgi:hypothetical protein